MAKGAIPTQNAPVVDERTGQISRQWYSFFQYLFRAATQIAFSELQATPLTKTADFTVGEGETLFINDKAGSTCEVTLPDASLYTGRFLFFVNYKAFTIVSASSNVKPRSGGAVGTAMVSATAGAWGIFVSNGTYWLGIAGS